MKRKHIARKIFAMTIAATMCMGLSPAGSVFAASNQTLSYTAVQADPAQPTNTGARNHTGRHKHKG